MSEEKKGFFSRLKAGLTKTRDNIVTGIDAVFHGASEIDEDFNEIRCPECGNLIELDWNGNPDNDQDKGCGGNCSGCSGCK